VVDLAVEVLDTDVDLFLLREARDLLEGRDCVFDFNVIGDPVSVARHGDDVGKAVFGVGFNRGEDAGNSLLVLCFVVDGASACWQYARVKVVPRRARASM
jgi:hypothetical protein